MIVGGMPGLFPLTNLQPRWKGYFMDKDGNIFSTKQSLSPRKMNGSTTISGRYVTLSNGSGYGESVSVASIINQAARHRWWKKETAFVTDTPIVNPGPPDAFFPGRGETDRHHATSLKQGIERRGWIIGQVSGEALVFGSKPKVHTTLASVKSEIERLATRTPGMQLVYLKIEGAVRAASIVWE